MPKPRSRVNPGRRAAAEVLAEVDRGEHAEDALARLAPVDPADRGLAWNLVLGVLRVRSALDAVITVTARRAPRNLDRVVLQALRVGIYELRYARVPDYAAVDQAVELVRALGAPHAAGFVNAVLRNQGKTEPSADEQTGHPAWLRDRWRARHGADADRWMEGNNQPAPLYIVAKEDPAGVARAFQHAGIPLTPVESDSYGWAGGVFRVGEEGLAVGNVTALPGFTEGRWWVMDPAAVSVADLVGDVDGVEVLDTCAAPGGKSFRLASRGARVYATDVEPTRLERVQEGAERLDLPVWAAPHDWMLGALERTFPVVLVDAPCTGLGTLRRHPDIRWRRREEDVFAMAARQRTILASVARCVAPGGVLVYAVCSPEPEEGAQVAATLGWVEEARFENAPGLRGEDVFQAYRLRAPA